MRVITPTRSIGGKCDEGRFEFTATRWREIAVPEIGGNCRKRFGLEFNVALLSPVSDYDWRLRQQRNDSASIYMVPKTKFVRGLSKLSPRYCEGAQTKTTLPNFLSQIRRMRFPCLSLKC
jgi:hypothetical protein